MKKGICVIIAPVFALTACGGGSSGSSDDNIPQVNYSINTNATDGGTISPAQLTVKSNSRASFTLIPDDGYQLDSVTGCGGTLTDNAYVVDQVGSNCTISVSFSLLDNKFIVYTAQEGKGTIVPTQLTLEKGDSATFSVEAEHGHYLSSIDGCNGVLSGNEYKVSNLESTCVVTVNFSANTYSVETRVGVGGSAILANNEVSHGDSTTASIYPHTDHTIGEIYGCNGTLTNAVYSTGSIHGNCRINVAFDSLLPLPELPLTRVRIPVVVHVLENEGYTLTDEDIISQIEATNRHFRKQNSSELLGIPDSHKPFIGDSGIQFYLADKDPNGNHHTGIIRLSTATSVFSLDYNFAKAENGGSAPWPNDRYINIWVGNGNDRWGKLGIAGRAHIPGFAPDTYLGVSVAETLFGTVDTPDIRHNQGKTLTHELGHFLGLVGHTNGEMTDDNTHANLPCSSSVVTTCKNTDLTYNFMRAQADDEMLKMFSSSQISQMREWLEAGPLQALYLNNIE